MAKQTPVDISARWDRPAVPTGEGETWLVVTVTTAVVKAQRKRPAVDVAFIIDRSGSMSGDPLRLAKQGVIDALDLLNDNDGVAVVAYDHMPQTVTPLIPATGTHRAGLGRTLRELEVAGSTNLHGGWELGCVHLTHPEFGTAGRIRRAILLTDGLANVGVVDPRQITWDVARKRVDGITTSTLGLGSGIDGALLSGMAEAGGGNFAFVEHAKGLPAFFARELGEALSVVATRGKLTLTLPKGVRAKLLTPFPAERNGKQITVALGDLPAGMCLDLVFSVTTRAKSEGALPPLGLTADWIIASGDQAEETPDRVQPPVDTLMVVDPRAFATMPRDEKAAEAVARVTVERARRDAMQQYRAGNVAGARQTLGIAQMMARSAPISSEHLVADLEEAAALDPSSPDFGARNLQIESDAHRRSRGREA